MDPEDTLVDIIEEVYDRAILKRGRNTFNMKKYLEENKFKKSDVTRFVESGTAGNISCTIGDLDHYIKHGGQEIKGAYPNLNTDDARKIRKFLYGILSDAWNYEQAKKPKRPKRIRTK